MEVPFFKPDIDEQDRTNVLQVLDSGWLTTGNCVHQFEKDFANYIGVKHCVAVNSATAALHLSIVVSPIKSGDYVLVPTMTFASTAEILYQCGVNPILVDCNLEDLSISLEDARNKLQRALQEEKSVTGIIPVHYAGKMVDLDTLEAFAQEFNLTIIEDAAHCCGSQFFSKKNGQWIKKSGQSLTQCYSFYCNKCITTCGEGGMIATDSEECEKQLRCLSLHGLSSQAWERFGKKGSIFYDIIAPGYKYNLTDVAAAMGLNQLKKAERLRKARAEAVIYYKKCLENHPYIIFLEADADRFLHSYHLCVVRLSPSAPVSRDALLQKLKESDIVPSVHWKPLHLHSFYQHQGFSTQDFPNATQAFGEILSLPLFPAISKDQIEYVVSVINKILGV